VVPYTKAATKTVRGCIAGEVALKRRRTGRHVKDHDIYSGPSDAVLPAGVIPHFSHLNQMAINVPEENFKALSDEERRCLIENEFQVAGIVGTTAEPEYEGKQLGKNLFVVEIGGVRSIINNNPTKTILQGQLVMARAPVIDKDLNQTYLPKAPTGTDPDKVLAVLEPFDPNSVVTRETIEHFLKVANPSAPKATPEETTAFAAKFVTYPKDGMEKPETRTHPVHFMRALVTFLASIGVDVSLDNLRARLLADGSVNEATMDLMNSYHVVNHHIQSHVLGIALSDAPPNTRFDLKFGSYAI
jgi:hypothetical protein